MPASFARLRIAGFKSFAEPVSIEILPGLTGIVGPNGCGKSNVVEALRWAMGESSARSLRGGEMDDLIFAGTAARPARNLAEVVLTLEDAAGLAPPPFHDQAELQISRRIERGAGSAYRVNGREMRARDVQTLFADLASGARSSAMVSQGQVAAIVGARPEERRSILEEAAGIAGLHARRHEAELKLRATEANLARAEDLRLQLDTRVQSLAGQASQAARYHEVASLLRDGETMLLALLHARARQAVIAGGAARLASQAALMQAEQRLQQAEALDQSARAALPAMREVEAAARTLLERRRIEQEGAAQEEARAALEAAQAEARLVQARRDHEEARDRLADATDALDRLSSEREALDATAATLPERREAAEARLAGLRAELLQTEHAARLATETASMAQMRTAAHGHERETAATRLQRAEALLSRIETEQAARAAALPDPAAPQAHEADCIEAAHAAEAAAQALDAAMARHGAAARAADLAGITAAEASRRHQAAMQEVLEADTRADRLAVEIEALRSRLQVAEAGLVAEADRAAAEAAVTLAAADLTIASRASETAEAARGAAMSSRLEAASLMADAGRQRSQLDGACMQAETALRRATTQHDVLSREHDAALAEAVPPETLAAAGEALVQADAAVASAQARLAEAEAAQEASVRDAERATAELAARREVHGRLAAEAEGLAQALAHDEADGGWRTLADELRVPPGLEAALASCLADGLEASCEAAAPRAWLELPALQDPCLPGDAEPLDRLVDAPPPLARALSRIGLIGDAQDGAALQASLQPGECLVDRAGALWRWDGYRAAGGLASAAGLRLQQRTRLREARARIEAIVTEIEPAAAAAAQRAQARDAAVSMALAAKAARAPVEQALASAREVESTLGRRDAELRARLDAVAPLLSRAVTAKAEMEAALAAARSARAALPDEPALAAAHEAARQEEDRAAAAGDAARMARAHAEDGLQRARVSATGCASRHAESEMACLALRPVLARIGDEHADAVAALTAARGTLAGLAPDAAATELARLQAEERSAAQAEQTARQARQAAEAHVAERGAARERIVARVLEARSETEALRQRLEGAHAERDEAAQALQALADAASRLPDPALAAANAAATVAAFELVRAAERQAAEARAALVAEQAALEARYDPLTAGLADWHARREAAAASLGAALQRLQEAQAVQVVQAAAPELAAQRTSDLASALAVAQGAHDAAAACLDSAEADLQQLQRERRVLEAELGSAREAALRAEVLQEQAGTILAKLLAETPEPPQAASDDVSEAAESALRRRIARLIRERDEIGPVNLRAELELREAEAQASAILHEREEIETAIARLRGQIGHLNREGRERLLAVFTAVDHHFQTLFSRMFGGGRAYLGMVGSDDPLTAGLEIYAQPPGKKLATLSLLSGGEQALTALSLIFAVFRCNPAPVCVLDEVDAPLDDANVERLCTLLLDMVQGSGTRFLVVTHHQLTMAYMDCLYGVTMQERGVSRILSVDLARASELVG